MFRTSPLQAFGEWQVVNIKTGAHMSGLVRDELCAPLRLSFFAERPHSCDVGKNSKLDVSRLMRRQRQRDISFPNHLRIPGCTSSARAAARGTNIGIWPCLATSPGRTRLFRPQVHMRRFRPDNVFRLPLDKPLVGEHRGQHWTRWQVVLITQSLG